jgi:methylated-DNA-[protein]-cysteine S-methyltransferase
MEDKDDMPEALNEACCQLDEYFKGKRQSFDLRLSLKGTEFQRRVWNELMSIPYGKTVTYRDIAIKLGNPHAVRAVGNANGKNPVSIIVPCHRVIGSSGKLTGYAGGLERKAWLLKHEKENIKDV